MVKKVDLSHFVPLGGKSRNYRNTKTGEIISRRQYDKLRGIVYEQKAKFSRSRDESTFYARPARGRTSAVKYAGETRDLIVKERKAAAEQKRKEQKQLTEIRKRARKVERKSNRRAKQKVVRAQLLKPGHMGARIEFDTYDGFMRALNEARALKVSVGGKRIDAILSYSIGIVGYDDRKGESKMLGATLWPMRDIQAKPISEDELMQTTLEFIEEKSYFVFLYWFIHLAFDKRYAEWKSNRGK